MAIVSVGYGTDSINEGEWAGIAAHLGTPYSYSSPNALRLYAGPGTREVALTDGWTLGHGVRDTLTGEKISLPAASSGTMSWLVCLRRVWGSGNRKTTLAYLQMSGASPVGRVTQPGVEDYQPLGVATVAAGSTTVASLVDYRVHAGKACYAPSLQAASMDPQLGAAYVLPNGDRYRAVITSSGGVGLEKEKDPAIPTMPSVPLIVAGTTTDVTFSSTGAATITHGLGWTPRVMLFKPRLGAANPLLEVYVSYQDRAVTATQAIITAKLPTNTAAAWKAYAGNLSYLDWVAYGGVTG